MNPRKVAGVLLGFGGVAMMIGPSLLSSLGTSALAQLACVTASLGYALAAVWARRFRRIGVSPLSVTTGQLTAGAAIMLPVSLMVDHRGSSQRRRSAHGARSLPWRCCAPPSVTCSISGSSTGPARPMLCWSP